MKIISNSDLADCYRTYLLQVNGWSRIPAKYHNRAKIIASKNFVILEGKNIDKLRFGQETMTILQEILRFGTERAIARALDKEWNDTTKNKIIFPVTTYTL